MKRPQKVAGAGRRGKSAGAVVALALTWDGARWPARTLPPKARAFLADQFGKIPSAQKTTKLLAGDQIREIRICWVPRLKGGDEVLSEPFQTPAGKRISYQSVKSVRFGDILGVIYRRR